MIACRPLPRIDRLWRAARAASAPSSTARCPQMGRAKDVSISMNQSKKQKTVTPIWRPVSTRSVWVVKGLQTNQTQPPEAVGCSERSAIGCPADEERNKMSSTISVSCGPFQDEPVTGVNITLASSSDTPSSISISREMEKLPENFDYTSGSVSGKALQQEQVRVEIMQDVVSEEDAGSANSVEKHSIHFEVDTSLMRFIKGKGGSIQKQIEEGTGVKIIFPSSKEDTCIVIEGMSTASVTRASQEIESVLEEAVKSHNLDYSHFVSLPLAIYPELVEKLHNFQKTILGDASSSHDGNPENDSNEETSDDGDDGDYQTYNTNVAVKFGVKEEEHVTVKIDAKSKADILSDMCIDKSIFIKPRTFHLTVLMLKLWNKDRVAAATEVLQKISSKVNDALNNKPVSIKLKGLECMRGSPVKARVLYAPIKEIGAEERLLRACQVIIEAYIEAGLVLEKDARQTLKLHATLMNARHRKRKNKTKRYDSFDARWILKRYRSEEWGDYLIREAHLSQRFSFDETGYYHCCASIPFPERTQAE